MNSKGSVMIYGLMLGLLVVVLALALANPISEFVSTAMNSSTNNSVGLDCDNSSISTFVKAACLGTDLTLFYFIGGLIFMAGALITAKIVFL